MIPSPWEFALLALAAWRLWKLLAEDTILDRPRNWLIGVGTPSESPRAQELIECPYCLGAWISIAWTIGFWVAPHWTVVVAVPFAVSAAAGLIAQVGHALAAVSE